MLHLFSDPKPVFSSRWNLPSFVSELHKVADKLFKSRGLVTVKLQWSLNWVWVCGTDCLQLNPYADSLSADVCGTGVRERTRGLATLPPSIQEPLVVTDSDGRPPRARGPSSSTLLLCVAGVHCWEISLGLADPGNVIFCPSCWFILQFSCMYLLCIVS